MALGHPSFSGGLAHPNGAQGSGTTGLIWTEVVANISATPDASPNGDTYVTDLSYASSKWTATMDATELARLGVNQCNIFYLGTAIPWDPTTEDLWLYFETVTPPTQRTENPYVVLQVIESESAADAVWANNAGMFLQWTAANDRFMALSGRTVSNPDGSALTIGDMDWATCQAQICDDGGLARCIVQKDDGTEVYNQFSTQDTGLTTADTGAIAAMAFGMTAGGGTGTFTMDFRLYYARVLRPNASTPVPSA